MMITDGPRYFPHRYRLRVPEWEMDVEAEPLVDAPAHRLPIEYWTGPVRIHGRAWSAARARRRRPAYEERSGCPGPGLVAPLRPLLAASSPRCVP